MNAYRKLGGVNLTMIIQCRRQMFIVLDGVSSISFATVDSDPGPSRMRNRPSLFGINRMTSMSSLRTSFDDFSASARSSHSFSLEGQARTRLSHASIGQRDAAVGQCISSADANALTVAESSTFTFTITTMDSSATCQRTTFGASQPMFLFH